MLKEILGWNKVEHGGKCVDSKSGLHPNFSLSLPWRSIVIRLPTYRRWQEEERSVWVGYGPRRLVPVAHFSNGSSQGCCFFDDKWSPISKTATEMHVALQIFSMAEVVVY